MEGILVSNGIEKISGRLNVDNKVNKYIDIGFALSLNRNNIDQVSADNAFSTPMQLVALSPITPPRDLEGNLYNTPTTTYYNGLLDVEYATRNIIEYRSIANGYLTFNLADGLKWRNEFGFDLYNLKENARYGKLTESGYRDKWLWFFQLCTEPEPYLQIIFRLYQNLWQHQCECSSWNRIPVYNN